MSVFDPELKPFVLEPQTRWIPLPTGGSTPLTYNMFVWQALEYLTDRGCFTVEQLVEFASDGGWSRTVPFRIRFSAVIAYWTWRSRDERGDYEDYCIGVA